MERDEEMVRSRVLERMDLTKELTDEQILEVIREEICSYANHHSMGIARRMQMQRNIFHSLRRLDVLQELLEDDTVTEIMVNGPKSIYVEREGRLFATDLKFASEERLQNVVQKIAADQNKVVNQSSPIVDTRLRDGSRVNIVLPPVAVDGVAISIRKFARNPLTMDRLVETGALSEELRDFLKIMVEAGYNIFISGGTGCGKTTFLNALAEYIPPEERVVTIEDSAELQLRQVKHLVRLEARNANLEGRLEISIRDLVRTSLRMRPDRIIVGECRGPEALEVLQAFHTGHDGSFSTGHANSTEDMLSRLETMVLMGSDIPLLAVRQQIASGIDIMVHLGRLRDKSRRVLEVSEVLGMKEGEIRIQKLYVFCERGEERGSITGGWERKNELCRRGKLEQRGLCLPSRES